MKRKPYTVQEKAELLKSDAIEKVANSSATYSKEFKVFAVGEYMTGKSPLQIFVRETLAMRQYSESFEWRMRQRILARVEQRSCATRPGEQSTEVEFFAE